MAATSTIAPPPSYQPPIDSVNNILNENSLPDYEPPVTQAHPVEQRAFEYTIGKKKGEKLASVKLTAALYSRSVPAFCGAGPVTGTVAINFKEPETINSIVVTITGHVLSGIDQESVKLFDRSTTLWSEELDKVSTNPISTNKKLYGAHSWPISINIPHKVRLSDAPGEEEYYLPQSFSDSIIRASVKYELNVRIARGKYKIDYNIPCTFGYFPIIHAPSFPHLKALAYQEGTPLLDPTIDIDGWTKAEKVNISGTLFNTRVVEVQFQLYISSPLVYTRGSVIPLYLEVQSTDQQALDLITTPKSIIIRLHRSIHYQVPESCLKRQHNYQLTKGKEFRDIVEAVWWPNPPSVDANPTSEASSRYLNGELHLKADLIPSSQFLPFTVQYSVAFYAVESTGFKMEETGKPIMQHPVDIVTAYGPGPRSVRAVPAGYNIERPIKHTQGVLYFGSNSFF